jgi:integrase
MRSDALSTSLKLAGEWYARECRASVTFGHKHPLERLTSNPTIAELLQSHVAGLTPKKKADALMRWGPIAPFWRALLVSDITYQTFKKFLTWRRKLNPHVKPNTLHKDLMLIRVILNYALNEEFISQMPRMPSAGTITKNPRPWFTPTEWTHLIAVSEARINEAATLHQERVILQRLELHEFMQAMVATMARVDELLGVRWCDVTLEKGAVVAQVTGKRGTRTLVAPKEAATIFRNRKKRLLPTVGNTNRIFPTHHRDAFRELLIAAKLRTNAQGYTRNLKSLRCTGISFRILESKNPNLLMIARNAGTSVAQIDDFYCKRLSAEMWKDDLSTSLRVAGDTLT